MPNISKEKRDKMLDVLRTLRGANAESPEVLQTLGDIEYELTHKKYGLVWEHHSEAVDEALKTSIPVFTEVKEKRIEDDSRSDKFNFLLEGDNLQSLYLLEKTHKERIDVIYIDPPYNTGNRDFIYDDRIVDSTDTFRHSKWLSFMEARLRIARNLLNSKGVIFISIDDNEQAALKLLCDEILGEQNFIGSLIWESVTQPTNAGSALFSLQIKTETILLYAKNISQFPKFKLKSVATTKSYPHQGKFGKCRFEVIEKRNTGSSSRPTMEFEILGQKPREGKRWQIGEASARELESKGRLEIVNGIVKKAVYPEDEQDKVSYEPFWSFLPSTLVSTAQVGRKELNDLFDTPLDFDTVKPLALIKKLLWHVTDENSVILDFFAGSGTTGQAVLSLNKEDGGHRQFILCTNNQNEICEKVTYERIARVSKGNEKVEALPCNLKYYKTEFVERGSWTLREDLLEHTLEMIELECGHKVLIPSKEVKNAKTVVLFTDEDAKALQENWETISPERVFLAEDSVLLSSTQEKLLKRVEVVPIPDDYFRFEINTEEV